MTSRNVRRTEDFRAKIMADVDATEDIQVLSDANAEAAAKKAEANRKKREKAKAKKQAAKATLEVKQLNADMLLLSPPSRLDTWFTAYQEAFAKEHEWMEARKQKTSRGMGLGAAQMMPLIFPNEAGSALERVPFFAMKGDDVVGYATVDVDPDPSGLPLANAAGRAADAAAGVGIAMLKAIVTAMPKRDLGLKYAKCHDYPQALLARWLSASAMTNFTCTWPCADRNDSRTVCNRNQSPCAGSALYVRGIACAAWRRATAYCTVHSSSFLRRQKISAGASHF